VNFLPFSEGFLGILWGLPKVNVIFLQNQSASAIQANDGWDWLGYDEVPAIGWHLDNLAPCALQQANQLG